MKVQILSETIKRFPGNEGTGDMLMGIEFTVLDDNNNQIGSGAVWKDCINLSLHGRSFGDPKDVMAQLNTTIMDLLKAPIDNEL